MTDHRIGTRKEWLTARLELLETEKELTRRSDELGAAATGAPVRPDRQGVPVRFRWVSSFGSDFNYDFQVSHTAEEWRSGAVEYNFRERDFRPSVDEEAPWLDEFGATVGTDWEIYRREGPGMSAFALEDGVVYHTYSAYERGIDVLWGMYQWLDRAPRGRNETGLWYRRHDEYDGS